MCVHPPYTNRPTNTMQSQSQSAAGKARKVKTTATTKRARKEKAAANGGDHGKETTGDAAAMNNMLLLEVGDKRVDEILGFFRCGICAAVPISLHNSPCGHSFCGECFTGMRDAVTPMRCPLCRVIWHDSRPNKAWTDMMIATIASNTCMCAYCRRGILRVNKDVHEGECPKKGNPCFHCKVLVDEDHRPSHRCQEGLAATLRASARELRETRRTNLALTTELMMLRETIRFQAECGEDEDDDDTPDPMIPPVPQPISFSSV